MPNIKRLKLEETELLREVLLKQSPSLLKLMEIIGIVPLTNEQKEQLWEAIADELVTTGLGENDEPNERGVLLDDLVGRIGSL